VKHSISNIALPSYSHDSELPALAEMGFEGLEVAPSRVWEDTVNLSFFEVDKYRSKVESAGLKILGLHSLFFDQPKLGLFRGLEVRAKTIDFLSHLSKVCSDLGGKTLVYGSPQARKRNDLSIKEADEEAISFFKELSKAIESHGTCFVIEALGENETDYINSARHALKISKAVNRDELKNHLDAKAVVDAKEAEIGFFRELAPTLVHYHANDPGLGVLGETFKVDHHLLGKLLRDIDYQGYVSIEQRMLDGQDPLHAIGLSYFILNSCY
jgi:sugar phosphate isomerase/epimerase